MESRGWWRLHQGRPASIRGTGAECDARPQGSTATWPRASTNRRSQRDLDIGEAGRNSNLKTGGNLIDPSLIDVALNLRAVHTIGLPWQSQDTAEVVQTDLSPFDPFVVDDPTGGRSQKPRDLPIIEGPRPFVQGSGLDQWGGDQLSAHYCGRYIAKVIMHPVPSRLMLGCNRRR